MAIESIAAVAAVKEVAGASAIEASKQLAEKMAMQAVENTKTEQQFTALQQMNQMESFRIGEISNSENCSKDILKKEELNAVDELNMKLPPEAESLFPKDVNGTELQLVDKTIEVPFAETGEIQEIKEKYVEDIVERSDVPETIDQHEAVEKEYHKLSPETNAEMRSEFNQNKRELRTEWERINNREWPCYKEDIYLPNKETPYRRAGDAYDAHHIQPLGLGGKNEARNLTPIHALEHADKMGVHALESPYDKLDKALGVV